MNAAQQIVEALKTIMPEGEANAAQVFKGYDMGTGQTGWHYTPFGGTAVFLGSNAAEALATIEDIATERAEAEPSSSVEEAEAMRILADEAESWLARVTQQSHR